MKLSSHFLGNGVEVLGEGSRFRCAPDPSLDETLLAYYTHTTYVLQGIGRGPSSKVKFTCSEFQLHSNAPFAVVWKFMLCLFP